MSWQELIYKIFHETDGTTIVIVIFIGGLAIVEIIRALRKSDAE